MNSLCINLEKSHFLPSEVVTGTVRWSVDKPPKCVTLHVGWHTAGRGTKDSCVEYEQEWQTEFTSGEERFSFTLPHAPYSFTGKLIELMWYISLEVDKGDAYERTDIVVSPSKQSVTLV